MPTLNDIANDTQKLLATLKASNRFGPFEQQLMSQLDAMNRNEELVEGWLENVYPLLVQAQVDLEAERAKTAELTSEVEAIRDELEQLKGAHAQTTGRDHLQPVAAEAG